MSDFNDEGRGVLFVNDRKQNQNSPDFTGNVVVGGVKKRLAAWKKEKNGKKFFSIQLSDFNVAPATAPTGPSIPSDAPPVAFSNNDPF